MNRAVCAIRLCGPITPIPQKVLSSFMPMSFEHHSSMMSVSPVWKKTLNASANAPKIRPSLVVAAPGCSSTSGLSCTDMIEISEISVRSSNCVSWRP